MTNSYHFYAPRGWNSSDSTTTDKFGFGPSHQATTGKTIRTFQGVSTRGVISVSVRKCSIGHVRGYQLFLNRALPGPALVSRQLALKVAEMICQALTHRNRLMLENAHHLCRERFDR